MRRYLLIAAMVATPTVAKADVVKRTATVKGTATVRIGTVSGNVVVTKGSAGRVSATIDSNRPKRITFDADKDGVRIGGGSPSDDIAVSVPTGTEVVVGTTSGDISVKDIGGEVRGRVTSGSLTVTGASNVDAVGVSGDVRITDASGDIKVEVVSGDVFISQNKRDDTKLLIETVSGDVEWHGRCAKGCRIDLQALSGDLDLYVDKKSSFDLEYRTRSGDFKNRANAQISKSTSRSVEAKYKTGLGRVQAATFSGDLRLAEQ